MTEQEQENFLAERGGKVTGLESGEWLLEYGIVLGGLSAAGYTLKAKTKAEALTEGCNMMAKSAIIPPDMR